MPELRADLGQVVDERLGLSPQSRLGWMLAGLALLGHFVALYLPGSPDGGLELPWLPGADKVVHFLLFAVPVYLLGRLTGRVWLVVVLFGLHAVGSEIIQGQLIPYREGDPLDALADLIGIGTAVLLLKWPRSVKSAG